MPLKTIDFLWVIAQGLIFLFYLFAPSTGLGRASGLSGLGFIAWVIALFGILLILVAMAQMGRILSPFPKPKAQAKLIRKGLFAWMRHPIYTGLFLAALGYGFVSNSVWRLIAAFLLLAFFYFKSRYEEQNLRRFFPDYSEYAKETGRFFPKF